MLWKDSHAIDQDRRSDFSVAVDEADYEPMEPARREYVFRGWQIVHVGIFLKRHVSESSSRRKIQLHSSISHPSTWSSRSITKSPSPFRLLCSYKSSPANFSQVSLSVSVPQGRYVRLERSHQLFHNLPPSRASLTCSNTCSELVLSSLNA